MIDTLDMVKNLLEFNNSDEFYYLQVLQRKKENPQINSNSRVIKNYYISSIDYLEDRYEEIKTLCEIFNARAMLRLNKRSYSKAAFKTIQNVANSIANGDYMFVRKSYDRACGNSHNDKNKKWIIDIDEGYNIDIEELIRYIDNQCMPHYETSKIIEQLPTKNGIHLISKPFNLENFKKIYPSIDIHKDNPINLYIPNTIK